MEFNEILKTNEFIGIVEDNKDPDKKGRIKVRIPYLHGDIKDIPTTSLPWSTPVKSNNNGLSSSIPDINKVVSVIFPNGELYYPEYKNALHLNANLQKKIETLSDSDYSSFIALCYNHNTQIYISTSEGLNLYHKKSGMQITDAGDVTTRLNGTKSKYKIGDEHANQAMLLSNNFFQWFDTFIDSLPTAYMGNNGILTVAQPGLVTAINQYKSQKNKFMSDNAFINDNGTISDNNIQTEIIIGDKYTNTIQNKELQAKVVEIQKEEIKQEKLIEKAKESIAATESDEKINADLKVSEDEIKKDIESLNTISTTNYNEVAETPAVSISDLTDDTSEDDVFESDNTSFGSESNTVNEDNNATFDDADVNEAELAKELEAQKNSVGGSGTSDNSVLSSGTKSKYVTFNNNKEQLDYSILTNKNGTYYFSEFMSYDRGIKTNRNMDNTPDNNAHLKNLTKVFTTYFDTTYAFFKELGFTLSLNSGYRNYEVNKAVGGAEYSQHKSGSAIDIILVDKNGARKNNLLYYYLLNKFSHYGQLIWEGNDGDGPRWCHISLNNQGKTGERIVLVGGVVKKPNAETTKILTDAGIMKSQVA